METHIFEECVFSNGSRGSLIVRDGRFVIEPEMGDTIVRHEMKGCHVFPGAIDTHVHFRDFAWAHKETWETGCRAALRGGVTTVFDMPNNQVPITTAELFDEKLRSIGERPISYRLYLGATGTPVNTAQIGIVARKRELAGVKIYNGSSTGSLLVSDPRDVRAHLLACAEEGVLPCIHAENEALITKRMRLFKDPRVCDHCFIRDTEVEVTAVREMLTLADQVGIGIYFCHVSTPEALELILEARERGQIAHIEVCPHHLYLADDVVTGERGGFFKMNPPLRSRTQVERMRELVCTLDVVDCIGSDHAPHTIEEKRMGTYATPSGVPGVQTLVPLLFNFVREGRMSASHYTQITSANAAMIFGLSRKGSLSPGNDADCYFLNPSRPTPITNEEQLTKCGWTPFVGIDACAPVMTVAKGVIYDWR